MEKAPSVTYSTNMDVSSPIEVVNVETSIDSPSIRSAVKDSVPIKESKGSLRRTFPQKKTPLGNWLYISRNVFTQDQLDNKYPLLSPEISSWRQQFMVKLKCNKERLKKAFLNFFPIISVVKNYSLKRCLLSDAVAGITTSFLQMPMGMALALSANLPPIIGLYTSFYPALIYLVFGTSRHICMGTQALVSLLTASVIDGQLQKLTTTLTGDEEDLYKIGVANATAFLSGSMLLAMGLLRFGFITSYLSSSFLGGFTEAAAIHIVTSQLPPMLNIQIHPQKGAFKNFRYYSDIFSQLGWVNPMDATIGIISLIILLVVGEINEIYKAKLPIPIPIYLIVVIVGAMISSLDSWQSKYGIQTVGDVPVGFMTPSLPPSDVMSDIFEESFVIAIIIFALSIAMAKLMSNQHNYPIDDNQELVAYGLCNFVGSFFRCQPNSTAPPRTMLLNLCGVQTTLNGIFIAVVLLVIILSAGPLFSDLPVSLLAAMIIATIKGLLIQVQQLPSLWRVSKPDFIVWVVTFLAGVILDLTYAMVIGILASAFTVIVFSQVYPSTLEGLSLTEHVIFTNRHRKNVFSICEVAIFYFPTQLYFANAEKFKRELFQNVLDPHAELESNVPLNFKFARPSDVNISYFYHDQMHFRDKMRSYSSIKRNSFWRTNSLMSDDDGASVGRRSKSSRMQHGLSVSEKSCAGSEFDGPWTNVTAIIIDCCAITYIDLAGINVLKLIMAQYDDIGIKVYLAACPPYMLELLDKSGFHNHVPRDCIVFEVHDALKKCQHPENEELYKKQSCSKKPSQMIYPLVEESV